jgi:two-component system alkaline phosphatase synthesis response regulator PhoP
MNTKAPKILIVDDEQDILEFLEFNFANKGFKVKTAKNGLKALKMAEKEVPDVILLDVMMPKMDGIETCRVLRENPLLDDTLIIFLTARNEDYTEISGFEAGGDDFITKPIRIRTLLTRVESLLKRRKRQPERQNIKFKNFEIDDIKREVRIKNKAVKLPKLQFSLLKLLASNPERVFTREEIFHKVWGNETIVGDRTLDVHIRHIRKQIGENFIDTHKGIGYSFKIKK